MSKPTHIFIVGLSRTGTTLTRESLNSSPEVGIGGESMFFGDRRVLGLVRRDGYRHKFARVGNLATDDGVERVVDYIYGIDSRHFWGKMPSLVDRNEFTRCLLATDRSERALLDLAMMYHAGDKLIRGDKTPAHLYAVPTLLEWFPEAKVIHCFRDPRAVYISNKRKYQNRQFARPSAMARRAGLFFELYASLDVALAWRSAIRLHREYRQRYPRQYYLSKFEDLLSDPRESVEKLCRFVEVPFQESMLQQLVLNSSFLPKRQRAGFDTSAISRWRQYIHPVVNRWFALWTARHLAEFGYTV